MRLPSVPTDAVVSHLNSVYFSQLWNTPDNNSRANFPLTKAAERIKTGSIPIGLSVVGLPTTDAVYAVYETSLRSFGRFFSIPKNEWVKNGTSLTKFAIYLTLYDANGRVIPSDQIYLRYISTRNSVLVAVDVKYTRKCNDVIYPQLYMTVYRDVTRSTPIVASSYIVKAVTNNGTPATTITQAITTANNTYPNKTTVAVNGWVYDPSHVPTLQADDVVAIVSDPDIVGFVDVTVDDNMTGYHSSTYDGYRELLHIPKSLNPNNTIITNDTLTAVVFDSETNRGVYAHRVDAHAIESVTHNDFSMGRSALDAFAQGLSAQSIKVRLYVRFQQEPNYLRDDVNHISDLYSLDDTEIVKQLLGLSTNQIAEWRAPHLESSPFLNFLYDFDGLNKDQAIGQFTAAMGYYDVLSALGQQMRYYTYRGSLAYITKPARLYGYPCKVIAFKNGIKISELAVELSDYDNSTFTLGFNPIADVQIGDRIAIYILDGTLRSPVVYNPTTQIPYLDMDSEDYTLVEVVSYNQPQVVWKNSVYKGYKPYAESPSDYITSVNADGTVRFEVRSRHYGKVFLLVPKNGLSTAVYPFTIPVINKDPILIDLKTTAINGAVVPMTAYGTMEVYINGYRLIDGIDYTCAYTEDANGYILQTLLAISNCDFLDLQGGQNTIEVVTHGDRQISRDVGYAIGNTLPRDNAPVIWTRSSGRVFVHGVLVEDITEQGNIVTVGSQIDSGSPFQIEWNVAYGAEKLMGSLSPNQDVSLRNRIDHLLGTREPTLPETVVVDHMYALYSPFLAQITKDVANGVLSIIDDPVDDRFLKQFKAYAPLLSRDSVLRANNPLLDRRFVTLAAHYANFTVNDPQQMVRLQRLISLTLTPTVLSIEDVLL